MTDTLLDLDKHTASFPLLDAETALSLLGGNTGLYARVVAGYRSSLDDFVLQTGTLLAQARLGDARASLHTAKGLALTVGAQQLAEVCRRGERRIRSALEAGTDLPAAELDALQQSLHDCVARTAAALDARLG